MSRRSRILATAALLAAALPVAAEGREMEVAMQDDLTILNQAHDRDLALIQFSAMGGTHIRMTIEHDREAETQDNPRFGASRLPVRLYDSAVDRVLEFGLVPQVTLFWRDQDDPKLLARWMGNVARHLGPRVNRYSVLNESDLYMPELHACTPARQAKLVRDFRRHMVRVDGTWRAKVATSGRSVPLLRACQRYERGLNYKRVFAPAAEAIRKANPDAEILAGETSALRGLDWFFRGSGARRLDADGWAHHPFQFTDLTPRKPANNFGIGNLALVRRAVRMPVYLTEFAYPHPNSIMDKALYGRTLTDREVARALPLAWEEARQGGARQMLQFQWFQKKDPVPGLDWDTALIDTDDGKTSPQYRALRKRILSWR